MINFSRVATGITRGNNCWRLLITSWRSVDKRPVALPFITGRIEASHRDISVLMQLPGQCPAPGGGNCPLISDDPRRHRLFNRSINCRGVAYSSWRKLKERPVVALPFITGCVQVSPASNRPVIVSYYTDNMAHALEHVKVNAKVKVLPITWQDRPAGSQRVSFFNCFTNVLLLQ